MPRDPNFEARTRESFARQGFMSHICAELVRVEPGFCEVRVPFTERVSQQHGYFHGGVVGAVADNVGAYAAFSLLPRTSTILTVEFKINLLVPALGVVLYGRGHVVRSGRHISTCRSDIVVTRNGEETTCAIALVTMMALEGRADQPANKST